MKRRLQKFSSDAEAAEWIDSHDTSEYMDGLEVVTEAIPVRRSHGVRKAPVPLLSPDSVAQSKQSTKRKDPSRVTNNRPR